MAGEGLSNNFRETHLVSMMGVRNVTHYAMTPEPQLRNAEEDVALLDRQKRSVMHVGANPSLVLMLRTRKIRLAGLAFRHEDRARKGK